MKLISVISFMSLTASAGAGQLESSVLNMAVDLRRDELLRIRHEPTLSVGTYDLPLFRSGRYPLHRGVVTTTFWPGEPGNMRSAFDPNWVENAPHQNLFFFALPYTDLLEDGNHTKPDAATVIPWFKHSFVKDGQSVLQGRWIAVRHGNRVCYASWQDTGPHYTDDADYVFLGKPPRPSSNGAALDVSPAVRDYLGMSGKDLCDWQFADRVPAGPWKTLGNSYAKK